MPSIGTLGSILLSEPKSLKVKRQAFPHDGRMGLKCWAPASPPVTGKHHGARAKGATGHFWESLGWHRCYLLCPELWLQSVLPPGLYHFECYRKINYKKIHLSTSLLLGWAIFFHQFLVIPECPFPYWEAISPCLWNLAATEVLIEDALKLFLGGKLTIFAKWDNSWMGEAIYGCLIKRPSYIK